MEALLYDPVLPYLRRIVGTYLSDILVVYQRYNGWSRRKMSSGVLAGFDLGPLLWNMSYDWIVARYAPLRYWRRLLRR